MSRSANGPAVSVIMPVFNGERFLAAAVESILSQTFGDLELIVVDDGSTDGTPALLDELRRRDVRISVVTQQTNLGVVAARNRGMRQARALLVAVMDSDDIALPNRLALQVAFMQAHEEIAAIGGAVQLIDEDGVPGAIKTYPLDPALLAWSMLFFNSIAHSTLMIRRSRLGSGYPEGAAEDYALLMDLCLRVPLANLPDVLVQYRTSANSLTSRTWASQEQHANGIVGRAVDELTGRSTPFDQVRALRGLSRHQYPTEAATIVETSHVIRTLAASCARRMSLMGVDPLPIHRDAAVRLLLMTALAVTRASAREALSIGASALQLSPASPLRFAQKVAGALIRGGMRSAQ